MIGGAPDIQRRSSIKIISWVEPTLCSSLVTTLCWSCIGATAQGTRCSLPSGRIHAWHGLVRKAGPPGHIASSDNFSSHQYEYTLLFLLVSWRPKLTPFCSSILANDPLLTGMGPGSVGGIAWWSRIFGMPLFWGQSNDCIGSGLPMGQGTMHQFHGFPTILMRWGICISLPCIPGMQEGSDSNRGPQMAS
jgi:hypothetical protein